MTSRAVGKSAHRKMHPGIFGNRVLFREENSRGDRRSVGIIKSVIGGKRCECYCSREAMLSNEHGKQMMAEFDAQADAFDAEKAQANYDQALAAWTEKNR